MANQKRVVPEFMSRNPEDTFRVIMPLNLELDFEAYGNSHFNVIIKNETTGEHSLQQMSPELLFTHFSLEQYFINGKANKKYYTKDVNTKNFSINTNKEYTNSEVKLSQLLSETNIVSLLGWKRKFLFNANHIYCYHIKYNHMNIIIPHSVIAVYYYYRSTPMREATLNCRLDDLYEIANNDPSDASIILKEYKTDIDAAFIHRFACQDHSRKAFDNMSLYIHNYLKYMKDKYPDKDITHLSIKARLPVEGEYSIEGRTTKIINEDTNTEYYYIHEILNDTADIGFYKFTKYLQKNNVITKFDDLSNLQTMKKELPDETTQVLKVTPADKKFTRNDIATNKKINPGSLLGIEIESKDITNEETINILKIYEESISDEAIDQSLTESSQQGNETIRKTVVSSRLQEEQSDLDLKDRVYTHNFDEFKQYAIFLESQDIIKNFKLLETQKMTQFIDKETQKVNIKCRLQGREREYITATFEYNNFYVGLLELENANKSSTSTWVMVSTNTIGNNLFDKFLNLYIKDNESIIGIKDIYRQNKELQFTTKKHARSEKLTEEDLVKWTAGLLGKVVLNL